MRPKQKVLFVDDEPYVLAAVARQLRRDFDIVTACGSCEGLASLATELGLVAVVADMQMPGMDGIEFLERAKAEQPKAVRLMLSGNADQNTARRAREEAGVTVFLSKPCSPEVLRDAIFEAIERAA